MGHVPVATTSRDQQVATEAPSGGAKLSRTELNVLQTMIAVIVFFILCWTVPAVISIFQKLQVSQRVVCAAQRK